MVDVAPGRVLVVDDNQVNIDLLESVLESRNFEVLVAFNGSAALRVVQEETPEIILLDINMPKMDGFEVCRRLKANPETSDIPVIFISAKDDTEDIVKAFDVGGVDYITKPFKSREVIARVEGQLHAFRQTEQIRRLREREKQQFAMLDQMRQQFIGSATHDLKNPLFNIAGYTSVLETIPAVSEDEEAVMCIGAIKRGVDKMQSLVYDMLDLLELERGIVLNVFDVDFPDFVRESILDFGLNAQEKHIEYRIHVPDEAVPATFDKNRMARVLENLVSNAIKYTPNGGYVEVNAQQFGDMLGVEVIDNGLGIPDDMLGKLFIPFERVRSVEHMAQEGNGLGLSVVKAIVEQHGGRIEVESVLGEGSVFRVYWPRYQ